MEKTIKIVDKNGLHARPASLLTKIASEYENDIQLIYEDKNVTLKSILAVMSLSIPTNSKVTLRVEGENSEDVLNELVNKFIELELIKEDSV